MAGFVVVASVDDVDLAVVLVVLAGLELVPAAAVVVVTLPPELPRVGLADAVIFELLCATELDTPEIRVGPGTM